MKEYIRVLLEQVRCKKAHGIIEDEIRGYIEEQTEANILSGMSKDNALKEAIKDMGSPIEAGALVKPAFIQAVGAMFIGALLAAIYLRTKNIWVLILIHAFIDFSTLIETGFYGVDTLADEINKLSYINIFAYLIYIIPIVFLLRKKEMRNILV